MNINECAIWWPWGDLDLALKYIKRLTIVLFFFGVVFTAEITEEEEQEEEAEAEETNATPGDQEEQSEAKDPAYGALCQS